ncbi:snapalysin [Streptomyces violens]|uniref:snapalysin n=1 Tax=Streptomyces violens TaxID=66377 RepID=UPI0004BE9D24|nr:snapalysin [Streptomyces violens]
MRSPKTVLSAALGLGLAASLAAAVPAVATPSAAPADNTVTAAQYVGSAAEKADTKRFFEAVLKSALAKQKKTGAASVTVTYDASGAPTFARQISSSAQIWNSAVSNVKLQEGSGGDFQYREGNDPRGSYASTDGHGRGYIFLDYQQNQEYDSTRVTAHETGHVLGLPDHYEGPCSELMSGGGPGPSCTNAQPDANERAEVDQLWANGLKGAHFGKAS